MNGEIVWYSSAKRYGFVAPVDGGGDVFFVLTDDEAAELAPLAPGQAVRFTLAEDDRGPFAARLERGFAPEPD